jgi:drug/metabolite transporter (DMT)-like permease
MSPESLYGLVLLAAAAHAIWNALVKRAEDALLMMAAIRLVGLVFGLAVVPFLPWPDESTWLLLALACTATFAYYGLLIRCYKIGDLSLVYPIARGSAPLVLALIAFLVIDEHLTATQIAGIVLISVGILALVIGKGGDRRAVGYALATGISIATYSFLGGLGVRSSASVFGFQAWLEILTGIGMLAFAMMRRPGKVLAFVETSGGIGLIAGALSVAGYLAFLTAAKVLPLAPIAALRECGLIFGALIGAVVFKEGFGTRRIVAAGLVAAGATAIAARAFY